MWVQRRASELKTGDVVRDFGALLNVKPVHDRQLVAVWRVKESGSIWPASALVEVDVPEDDLRARTTELGHVFIRQ